MTSKPRRSALTPSALLFMAFTLGASAGINPAGLQCDGQADPIAATAKPRLSWRIESNERNQKQNAYHVLVASSKELLDKDQGDLWDSGKVSISDWWLKSSPSDRGHRALPHIRYAGKDLTSGQRAWWKVRSWDTKDQASPWSAVATFEVGPNTPADWQGAQWIDDGKALPDKDEDFYKEDPAPLLRREFQLEKPIKQARLHVAGIGLCYPSLNGTRVADHLFEPAWTDFEKRILFRSHDVTAQLKAGSNCIGLELGNGWYNPLPLRMWGGRNIRDSVPLGRPRAIALLVVEHTDGSTTTLTTGKDWQTTEGPTLRNSIYLGEVRDSRLNIDGWNQAGLNTSAWKAVRTVDAPLDVLQPLQMRPVRSSDTLTPTAITQHDGVTIVDFGTNFTGLPELTFDAPAGTRITLRYGELLHPDGLLNPMTSVCGQIKGMVENKDGTKRPKGGPGAPEFAWQSDTIIARGGVETYKPDFTFRAFRYMEISGLPSLPKKSDIKGIVFNTELPTVGTFACSDPLLNRIQQMCLRTFHSNTMTVQSDCPHRERFGYGGDICATSEAFMMNFDMAGFYTKTVRDWGDAQLPDGLMPDTAPYVGIKYCGVGWGMVHPQLIEQIHQHYGDTELVREQLDIALRWIDAEAARRVNGLVTIGLGDHEAIGTKSSSRSDAIRTPKFIDAARRIARLANLVGRKDDANRCNGYADESQQAWVKAFLDPKTGVVAENTQTELTFALGFGAVPADQRQQTFDQLVKELTSTEDSPRLTTGIYGTWKLLELLPEFGRNDLAFGLATRTSFPSWGWMLKNNATTLWEHWEFSDNTFSHNHPMFGSISAWYFRWLGGIQCAPDAVGFDRILIQPQAVKGLEWVKTTHDSIRGTIVSNWNQSADGIDYEITIPADTVATIKLPHGKDWKITESGKDLEFIDGSKILCRAETSTDLQIGSGIYHFKCTR